MTASSNIPVLVLEGSSREHGRIHGETLRAKIREYISRWKHSLGEATGIDPDVYIGEFLAHTDFHSAINRWTPDLLDEVRGIAEGSGLDWETVFAHQLADEEWWYGRYRHSSSLDDTGQESGHCTALGVFGQADHPPLLAQTWDMPNYVDEYQVLLHMKHQESDLESFVITIAGVVGAMGLNNRSVGVCVNTMLQLDHRVDGLPVDFVVRGLLSQSSLENAAAFVQRVKHASGQNYMIGGPTQVLSFESSANQVRQYTPSAVSGRVYHTNHPIANDDLAIYEAALTKATPEEKEAREKREAHSRKRFDVVANQVSDASKTITVETIKSILSSHEGPVCCHKGKDLSMTAGCVTMELSTSLVLHFAPGPPCSSPFERFTF